MEFASAIAVEIVKSAISPLVNPISYFVHYKRNVKNLERKIEDLKNLRADIQTRVTIASRNLDSIRKVVEIWLEKVDIEITTTTTENFRSTVESMNHQCFKGCCSCCNRYNIGREAQKRIVIIEELLNQGNSFIDDVSNPLCPLEIESMPTNRDFEAFASRESIRKKVMEALMDEETYLIGLYGMGGVGKTMLMNQIGNQVRINEKIRNQVKKEELFDVVVMITVSQNLDLKRIQGEIANKLGLERIQTEEDISTRAAMLLMRLQQESILVILDDLWMGLDLSDVGIPLGKNHHKVCKVVITTRSLNVCTSMITQKNIEVKGLSEEDSKILFKKNVGDVTDLPALKTVATQIVEECGGLPIALVTLGRALRNKDQLVWDGTLLQLKNSKFDLIEGMNSKVYSSIKLSYDYLGNEIMQKIFLFCCLFPEDHIITMDELMMYVMGDESLLEGVDTLKQVRYRLHTVVDKLIASCLLLGKIEKDTNEYSVSMHDIIRYVAISIASSTEEGNVGFFVKAGLSLKHWPRRGSSSATRKCKHLSLMRNEISLLPDQPELPHLLTLSLEGNKSLKEIPNSFFENMDGLQTLDLRRTGISSLPSSLSCVKNLRALHLDYCLPRLIDVSLIGKLELLEILSLQHCELTSLPEEIRGLIHLRSLNLSENPELCFIPPNVISRLSRLEELYMWDSFRSWETEGKGNGNNASLVEVASLISGLTVLHLDVDYSDLQFQVSIGRGGSRRHTNKHDISDFFECILSTSPPICDSIKVLLERVCSLVLTNCTGLRSMGQVLAGGLSNHLKFLFVKGCNEMDYLMSVREDGFPRTAFDSLEKIQLHHLCNLRKIFHGPLPVGFLDNLKILEVENCDTLDCIFSSSMFTRFQNLEVLDIYSCTKLKDVFQVEEGFNSWPHLMFPNLRELTINKCPSLTCIFPSIRLLHGGLSQLQILRVRECNNLKQMVNADADQEGGVHEKMMLPQLQEAYFEELSRFTSIWKGSIPINSLQNLRKLKIMNCHTMKHLFPSFGLVHCGGGLLQFERLEIWGCKGLEEIFNAEKDEDEVHYDKKLFPQLRYIYLSDLPNLKTIAWGVIPFESLINLSIVRCGILKYVFSMRLLLLGGLMKLEKLVIQWCENLEVIINRDEVHGDVEEDNIKRVLPALKVLNLDGLPKLSTFYQQDQLATCPLDWPAFLILTINECKNLKRLPFTRECLFKLKELNGDDQDWFEGLEWEEESINSHLKSIFKLHTVLAFY